MTINAMMIISVRRLYQVHHAYIGYSQIRLSTHIQLSTPIQLCTPTAISTPMLTSSCCSCRLAFFWVRFVAMLFQLCSSHLGCLNACIFQCHALFQALQLCSRVCSAVQILSVHLQRLLVLFHRLCRFNFLRLGFWHCCGWPLHLGSLGATIDGILHNSHPTALG